MGRIYSVSFVDVSVSAAQDLFEILCAADKILTLHAVNISQRNSVTSEQLLISLRRVSGAPTSGSGGSTPSAVPLVPGDASSGATIEANNTTQLTGGTNSIIWAEAFNALAGFSFVPPYEMRPKISGQTRFLVELEQAPAAALTMSGTIIFEED